GKTPIVVNDSRGFYTSRVFGTYTREAVLMLADGVRPALIENGGKAAGMPMAPLALSDEVAISLIHQVAAQTAKDLGDKYQATEADRLIAEMVERHGRPGRRAGKGFYDYPPGSPKRLWPGLSRLAPVAETQPSLDEVKTRFLAIQALEAARCPAGASRRGPGARSPTSTCSAPGPLSSCAIGSCNSTARGFCRTRCCASSRAAAALSTPIG